MQMQELMYMRSYVKEPQRTGKALPKTVVSAFTVDTFK